MQKIPEVFYVWGQTFVLNADRYSEIQAGVLIDMHLLVRVQRIPS
jgi:hypothetical protein